MEFINWFLMNVAPLLGAANGVLLALIALFMIIPGEQPEKALQAAVDFLAKFSKK